MRVTLFNIGFDRRFWSVLLTIVLVSGCAYHPPAPIEEHSTGVVKRQLSSDGSYYVRKGDTLYAIAFGYDVDPKDIAKWNNISSPYTIYPGQQLRLVPPSGNRYSSGSPATVHTSGIKSPGQVTTKTVKSPASSTTTSSANTAPTTAKSATASSGATTTKTAAGSMSWRWPTKGRVIRGYVAGDPARNGLEIAGKEGQDINASSGGQVVYSGDGLIGYGELIIIKHNEKMLSAYAHNKIRLVKEGEQVKAGQKIAEMGRDSTDEQLLHFEIRVNGKPVNPLTYLTKK